MPRAKNKADNKAAPEVQKNPDAGQSGQPMGVPAGAGQVPETVATQAARKSKDVPGSVTLSAPHGFIDENEVHRYWHPGQVVTDPDEVALLIERKAPLEGIEHEG